MKISFIGNNLKVVSEEELGRVAACCIKTMTALEAYASYVEAITVDFVFLNNVVGPAFRIYFKKIVGKSFWVTADFRLIKEDEGDTRKYPDIPNEVIVGYLTKEVLGNITKYLTQERLTLEDESQKILKICPNC